MKLDKQELLRMLRTQGDNDTADEAERKLPDEVDTDRDGDALDALGLDRTQLMAKLAGGGFGGTIAP
ncbi:hypothetical protein FHU33_0192 [Blastococcus colisei]|uniref:Uncharacterized protein n=1 Tax=Blastococcus colisei TaxID=1564162 RepID=A0A543P9S9_9ACTN|nr:hypothetical protein [Blastococcus colisei]TQN40841.1 hypothetical protein FHU33_0192 [Blastococcus colisei]